MRFIFPNRYKYFLIAACVMAAAAAQQNPDPESSVTVSSFTTHLRGQIATERTQSVRHLATSCTFTISRTAVTSDPPVAVQFVITDVVGGVQFRLTEVDTTYDADLKAVFFSVIPNPPPPTSAVSFRIISLSQQAPVLPQLAVLT